MRIKKILIGLMIFILLLVGALGIVLWWLQESFRSQLYSMNVINNTKAEIIFSLVSGYPKNNILTLDLAPEKKIKMSKIMMNPGYYYVISIVKKGDDNIVYEKAMSIKDFRKLTKRGALIIDEYLISILDEIDYSLGFDPNDIMFAEVHWIRTQPSGQTIYNNDGSDAWNSKVLPLEELNHFKTYLSERQKYYRADLQKNNSIIISKDDGRYIDIKLKDGREVNIGFKNACSYLPISNPISRVGYYALPDGDCFYFEKKDSKNLESTRGTV